MPLCLSSFTGSRTSKLHLFDLGAVLMRFCLINFRSVGIKDTSPGRYNYSLTHFKTADGEKINLVNDIKISGKFPIFTYKDRRGRGKVAYLYKRISPGVRGQDFYLYNVKIGNSPKF